MKNVMYLQYRVTFKYVLSNPAAEGRAEVYEKI